MARGILVGALSLAFAAYASICAADDYPSYIKTAIADPARATDAPADVRRNPAELLAFAQVKPGDTVVDLIPGGGYWDRLFSAYSGGHGGGSTPSGPTEYVNDDPKRSAPGMQAAMRDPHYANVSVLFQSCGAILRASQGRTWCGPRKIITIIPTNSWVRPIPIILNPAIFFDAFEARRCICGCRSCGRSGFRICAIPTHFTALTRSVVRQHKCRQAGFSFDGESNVLRNPADPHTV